MNLTKSQTIELIQNGAVLVKAFDRMYGSHFYVKYNNKMLYNVSKPICNGLIKELKLKPFNMSYNETQWK